MRIKRFEQLNEGMSKDRMKQFRDKVEKLMKGWDEAMEVEPENEPSYSELAAEVGDIMNEFEMTTKDLRDVVAAYPRDGYILDYVKPQLDYEEKEAKTYTDILNKKISIVKDILKDENDGYGVDKDTIETIIVELGRI